jgi:hypothetical protein
MRSLEFWAKVDKGFPNVVLSIGSDQVSSMGCPSGRLAQAIQSQFVHHLEMPSAMALQ